MADPWYDSKVFAVVVGTVLGLFLPNVPKKIEDILRHRSFRKILKKEIQSISNRLESHMTICVKCHDQIAKNQLQRQALSDQLDKMMLYTEYPTTIFMSNLDKLTPFPDTVIEGLIEFYGQVDECRHRVNDLMQRDLSKAPLFCYGMPGDPELPRPLIKAEQLLGPTFQKGQALLKEIDRSKYFAGVRRVLSRIAAKLCVTWSRVTTGDSFRI